MQYIHNVSKNIQYIKLSMIKLILLFFVIKMTLLDILIAGLIKKFYFLVFVIAECSPESMFQLSKNAHKDIHTNSGYQRISKVAYTCKSTL